MQFVLYKVYVSFTIRQFSAVEWEVLSVIILITEFSNIYNIKLVYF